jgi:fructokinase
MFLVCGEALFDFFLETESGPGSAVYAARAGGSPFNVAIGLSRLGVEAGLCTGLSDDMLGSRLGQVLADEGVSRDYSVATKRPTTISLVGLDPSGVPAYQFYGRGAADTGVRAGEFAPLGSEVAGLHFGSYSIAVAPVADAFAQLAREEMARFISLDPNIRPTIEPDMDVWRERIDALIPFINTVKASVEDLDLLHPGRSAGAFAADLIARGVSLVVVTGGGSAVRAWSANGIKAQAVPPQVSVIDTVGAGDTFQAALIAQLCQEDAGPQAALKTLDTARLERMLDYCARASAITCSRRGADMPRDAELIA